MPRVIIFLSNWTHLSITHATPRNLLLLFFYWTEFFFFLVVASTNFFSLRSYLCFYFTPPNAASIVASPPLGSLLVIYQFSTLPYAASYFFSSIESGFFSFNPIFTSTNFFSLQSNLYFNRFFFPSIQYLLQPHATQHRLDCCFSPAALIPSLPLRYRLFIIIYI